MRKRNDTPRAWATFSRLSTVIDCVFPAKNLFNMLSDSPAAIDTSRSESFFSSSTARMRSRTSIPALSPRWVRFSQCRIVLDWLRSFLHDAFMTETQTLIARVHALAKKMDQSPSTLSGKLFGNGKRLTEIEKGGSLTMKTYAQAIERLEELERAANDTKAAA